MFTSPDRFHYEAAIIRRESATGPLRLRARQARPGQNRRRGFSMILVVLAIGVSLALTYGFMRTQVMSLQLSQNDSRRDLALEAARTGISGALLRMQSTAWTGLSDTYSKIIQQDSASLVKCTATFSTVTQGQVAGIADAELPLHVCITSVGTWESPRDSTVKVTRTIKSVVRLIPRLPGRTARPGDVASATDLNTNPTNYQATLPFTLTATSSSSTSLNFDPGLRIEGPVWLNRRLALFNSEKWSSSVRSTMLTEIGNQYGAATAASMQHPHPLTGPIKFGDTPSNSIQTDLSRLKTSWSTTSQTPSINPLNMANWSNYQLFDKGPVYSAGVVSSSLSGVTLEPSSSNPLGIFVRSGNLTVNGQVVVRGTLVVSGTITVSGEGSAITAYNWLTTDGTPVVESADQWPRLPAIVAGNLAISSGSRAVVEGAVLINGQISGGGADFTYPSYNQVDITGNATAIPSQQPYSTVQLAGAPDLTAVSGNQNYAIWLANGNTGRWFAIQSVNNSAKSLTVVGEVRLSAATPYRISLNRSEYVSLNGPVVTGTANFSSEPMWQIASTIWNNTTSDWNSANAYFLSLGQPRMSFPDWVANPGNLVNQGWFLPWNTLIYGLRLEPTTSLQPMSGVQYLSTVPLFKPYSSSGSDAEASGYRWRIVEWREDI